MTNEPSDSLTLMARRPGRRLTPEEEDALIEAYQAWDPTEQGVQEFADEQAVSKQTVYSVLRRRGIAPKERQRPGAAPMDDQTKNRTVATDDLLDRVARQALTAILEENAALKAENALLKAELEERN